MQIGRALFTATGWSAGWESCQPTTLRLSWLCHCTTTQGIQFTFEFICYNWSLVQRGGLERSVPGLWGALPRTCLPLSIHCCTKLLSEAEKQYLDARLLLSWVSWNGCEVEGSTEQGRWHWRGPGASSLTLVLLFTSMQFQGVLYPRLGLSCCAKWKWFIRGLLLRLWRRGRAWMCMALTTCKPAGEGIFTFGPNEPTFPYIFIFGWSQFCLWFTWFLHFILENCFVLLITHSKSLFIPCPGFPSVWRNTHMDVRSLEEEFQVRSRSFLVVWWLGICTVNAVGWGRAGILSPCLGSHCTAGAR